MNDIIPLYFVIIKIEKLQNQDSAWESLKEVIDKSIKFCRLNIFDNFFMVNKIDHAKNLHSQHLGIYC